MRKQLDYEDFHTSMSVMLLDGVAGEIEIDAIDHGATLLVQSCD